jgi:hypothetical protein
MPNPPMGRPGMPAPQQPGQQRQPMDPLKAEQARKQLEAREMMLKSELLKIKAMKSMMPGAPAKGK